MAQSLLSSMPHRVGGLPCCLQMISACSALPLSPGPLSLHSPTDLSELLKEGTKEAHDRAENTQFVKDFLKGHIKRELFKVSPALSKSRVSGWGQKRRQI